MNNLNNRSFAVDNKVAALGVGKYSQIDEFVPGTAGKVTSTVEISISCRHLANKDVLSKSDPMCAVFYRPPGSRSWVPLIRTEVIENDLNPDFATKITLEYRFESVQSLRFEVYDVDWDSTNLRNQDNLGYVETTLAQVVSAGTEGLTLQLTGVKPSFLQQDADKPKEIIILIAEELASEKDEVQLKLIGSSIGTWNACLPPRTYFSVSKLNDANMYIVVYRSNFARGSNPSYPPLKLSSRALCNGDHDRTLKIEIYQRNIHGEANSVGSVLTTVNKLLKCDQQERMSLMTPDGQSSKSAIKVLQCTLSPIATFLDYVKSGMEIRCCFAIDFTCSNGDPEDPMSLHYRAIGGSNPYEQAIHAVGTIIMDYDKSNQLPAYGFGARIPPIGESSHCFPLTLEKSPNCGSITGLLDIYRASARKIMLYGPTYFAPVIKTVTQLASKVKGGEQYFILVIVTDGVITDLAKTKRAIIDASFHPISIIIIGVGEADFSAMEELDGDAVQVTANGKVASRDIVHFVAYRSARAWLGATGECTTADLALQMEAMEAMQREDDELEEGAATSQAELQGQQQELEGPPPEGPAENVDQRNNRVAESQLAKEVLFEIPDQLRSYMRAKGITPSMIQLKTKKEKKEGEEEEGA